MWSEGIPESSAVQEILHWQYYTIESMFTIVATAIAHQKAKDQSFDAKPSDYLNFYCLGNRETVKGSEAAMEPQPDTPAALLKETRRHLVYVHSKMTIVDDAVALIGSSNINQRSLDGSRDSELLMGLWQQKHLAGNKGVADGDVHAFRMQCFVHLTGVMDDAFREPSSLACVKRMNKIAEENWKLYTQEAVCDLKSYLLPYPITVTKEGRVKARTENGYFPDTKAKVTGADSLLPDFLTT
jgi:phospholipase D1/2